MLIGIEAERANHAHKTGVEHYARQLIIHLAAIDTENQYVLYLRSQPQEWFFTLPKNFSLKVMPFPIFWTQIRVGWETLIHPVDVLFIPASSMPVIHPRNTVVTVHDLAFMFFPESYTWFTRNFHKLEDILVKLFAKKIICVSESTKKDLIKYWDIDSKRITVVHHGYEKTPPDMSDNGSTPVTGLLPEKYVLFLSTLQPRKNLEGLIKAFAELKQQYPELPHKLVVVGKPGWKYEPILEAINVHKDLVIYLNHVSDVDRFVILKRAQALVLPSFYEGFGMQVLEAFETGVPVAVSNVSSMPEVAGDAAVYFDPHNTGDIKNALKSLLFDKALTDSLKEKGFLRLKKFSWEKCARETLEVLIR